MIDEQPLVKDLDALLDLASRLRRADEIEIRAASGMEPPEVLKAAHEIDGIYKVWLSCGVPVMAAGLSVSRHNSLVAVPWMIASDEADKYPKSLFVKLISKVLAEHIEGFRLLVNFVDNRNRKSHGWLEKLGFKLDAPAPFGAHGLPFRRFWMGDLGELGVTRHDTENNTATRRFDCVEVSNV